MTDYRQIARLKREARKRATNLGHRLKTGVKSSKSAYVDTYATTCHTCFADLYCETELKPNGGIIVGRAVTERCTIDA